jgi:hypothetical protein
MVAAIATAVTPITGLSTASPAAELTMSIGRLIRRCRALLTARSLTVHLLFDNACSQQRPRRPARILPRSSSTNRQ